MISFDKSNSNDSVIKQISDYANVTITRIIVKSKSRTAVNFEDAEKGMYGMIDKTLAHKVLF
jgi:phenylpyruvate tautomerase PptA (4-oxalocrotonate tautomerase family)